MRIPPLDADATPRSGELMANKPRQEPVPPPQPRLGRNEVFEAQKRYMDDRFGRGRYRVRRP